MEWGHGTAQHGHETTYVSMRLFMSLHDATPVASSRLVLSSTVRNFCGWGRTLYIHTSDVQLVQYPKNQAINGFIFL